MTALVPTRNYGKPGTYAAAEQVTDVCPSISVISRARRDWSTVNGVLGSMEAKKTQPHIDLLPLEACPATLKFRLSISGDPFPLIVARMTDRSP